MTIQICVGSSCHLKGSPEIVQLLTDAIKENNLEQHITLCGSFCTGHCNRLGVTVQIDGAVHTGITKENFKEFFKQNVLAAIESRKE